MNYFVYTLSCPITNIIKYVGKTNNLKNRYIQHNNKNLEGSTRKKNWIRNLHKKGFKPLMEVLEQFDNEKDCLQAESFWIFQLKHWGFNLYNHTNGGEVTCASYGFLGKEHKNKKCIIVYKDGIQIDKLYGLQVVANKYRISAGNLQKVCSGKHNSLKGYIFRYENVPLIKETTYKFEVWDKKDNDLGKYATMLEISKKFNINIDYIRKLHKTQRCKGYLIKNITTNQD